jgi:hypothetical protein
VLRRLKERGWDAAKAIDFVTGRVDVASVPRQTLFKTCAACGKEVRMIDPHCWNLQVDHFCGWAYACFKQGHASNCNVRARRATELDTMHLAHTAQSETQNFVRAEARVELTASDRISRLRAATRALSSAAPRHRSPTRLFTVCRTPPSR